jgi:hypothetical protein
VSGKTFNAFFRIRFFERHRSNGNPKNRVSHPEKVQRSRLREVVLNLIYLALRISFHEPLLHPALESLQF